MLGAPFYVMERVDGVAVPQGAPSSRRSGTERTAAHRRPAGRRAGRAARRRPGRPSGWREFGRPAGFLERQVRRWGKQLEGSKTREHPDADELHRRLTEQVAAVEAADPSVVGIVHGDYRLDNCLVGGDDQIHAVVDWEMATLGDTRTDLALMLVYETARRLGRRRPGLRRRQGHGLPGNDQQLAAYAAASGRELGDMELRTSALAYFKLAVILEGIHYRYLKGQTVGEGFDRIGAGLRPDRRRRPPLP